MSNLKSIAITDINKDVFTLIGKDWTLITAGNLQSYNTMTASWGGMGVLWNKNVATVYIRPQRYTYSFVEQNEYFTLSFFGEEMREALIFCGRNSGREYDKAKETGIIPIEVEQSVGFAQAELTLVCKKLYHSDIDPNNFYDDKINNEYQYNDYHRMYIAEITAVLVQG